jgi:hypothetical protein
MFSQRNNPYCEVNFIHSSLRIIHKDNNLFTEFFFISVHELVCSFESYSQNEPIFMITAKKN